MIYDKLRSILMYDASGFAEQHLVQSQTKPTDHIFTFSFAEMLYLHSNSLEVIVIVWDSAFLSHKVGGTFVLGSCHPKGAKW